MANGFADFLTNPMALNFLANAGQDMIAGGGFGNNLASAVKQSIATESFAKLAAKMLGGDIPMGGKMEMTDTGMKLTIPKVANQVGSGQPQTPPSLNVPQMPAVGGQTVAEGTPAAPAVPNNMMQMLGSSFLNPSSSPLGNLSPSDLAGLTPQDLSQLMQFKMAQDAAAQKSVTDAADLQLKQAQIDLAYGELAAKISKDDRPAAIQQYEYYVNQQLANGQPVKSIADWDKDNKTSHQREYEQAKAEGYNGTFYEYTKEMTSLSGGLDLGEKRQVEEMKDDVGRQAIVKSPEFYQKVKETLSKDNRAWRMSDKADQLSKEKGIPFTQAREQLQQALVINEMGKQIRQAYAGKNVEVRPDGWYVNGQLIQRNPYNGR